jgi:hypothetical protein
MTYHDQSHHLLDPLDETVSTEEVIRWVQRRYDGTASEDEIRTALDRTNGYTLPVQQEAADLHGETRYPAILFVEGGARTRPLLHLGQRFRMMAYQEKKRTGDFEITQIHVQEEKRGMEAHHIQCKRVLETKVSEARDNTVVFPHTAFDVASPWDHYNRVVWEVIEYMRAQGQMLSLVSAPDPSEPMATGKPEASVLWDPEDDSGGSLVQNLQAAATMSDRM